MKGERDIGRAEGNPDDGAVTVLEIYATDDFLVAGIVPRQHLDRVGDGVGDSRAARDLGKGLQTLSDSLQSIVPSTRRKAPLADGGVGEGRGCRVLTRRQINAISRGNPALILE